MSIAINLSNTKHTPFKMYCEDAFSAQIGGDDPRMFAMK